MAKAAVGSEFDIELGPWSGVFDPVDPKAAKSTRWVKLLNCRIPDVRNKSATVAREGFVADHVALGAGVLRAGQRSFMHKRLDGTIDRYQFCGGKMYRWDGDTTRTDVTPDNVTIDASNVVFVAAYNNTLWVTDEINQPWVYDPESRVATVVPIDTDDTPWTTKGGAVVYAGKIVVVVRTYGGSDELYESDDANDGESMLFESDDEDDGLALIDELRSGVQNTIVWSEEDTPLEGYVQDGFENQWRLTQTSTEVFGGLMAEEGTLVYVRNAGIGYITGNIKEDFKAAATRDTVSSTEGSNAPAAFILVKHKMWMLNMDGRPCRFTASPSEPQRLDYPMRTVIEANIGADERQALVVQYGRVAYNEVYDQVWFTIFDRQTIYAFDAVTGDYAGTISINGDEGFGIHIDAMDGIIDSQNRRTVAVLGTRGSTYTGAQQGVAWRLKHTGSTQRWLDTPDATVNVHVAVVRRGETSWLASNSAAAYAVRQVAALLLPDAERHDVGLYYITPKGGQSNTVVARSAATTGDGSNVFSRAVWGLGKNAQGSSVRFGFDVTHVDNVQWGIHAVTATCTVLQQREGAV